MDLNIKIFFFWSKINFYVMSRKLIFFQCGISLYCVESWVLLSNKVDKIVKRIWKKGVLWQGVDYINPFTLCAKLLCSAINFWEAFLRRKSLGQSVNEFMKSTPDLVTNYYKNIQFFREKQARLKRLFEGRIFYNLFELIFQMRMENFVNFVFVIVCEFVK